MSDYRDRAMRLLNREDRKLAKKAIAHFRPTDGDETREGEGPHHVWNNLIYCDLVIEHDTPPGEEAAANRIYNRAKRILRHVMKNTKGMSEADISSWLGRYIEQMAIREAVRNRRRFE